MDNKASKNISCFPTEAALFKQTVTERKVLENKMCSLKCILSWKVKGNDVLVYKKVRAN